MICTCTMNPSLDYYMEFEMGLSPDAVNRSQLEYYEAGGKGINVSIVLNNLGIPTKAYGFVGGFTKDFFIRLLQRYEHVIPNFTYTEGHTRINVKMCADKEHTDVNASGPYITDKSMKNLMNKVDRLGEGDYFVLAGITQEYLVDDVCVMLRNAIASGVRIILDTNPDLMKEMLKDKPFMIKTTPEELGRLVGRKTDTVDTVHDAMEEVRQAGCRYVMVVTDSEKAMLCCKEGTYIVDISKGVSMINTVGTGDSMVAGFLMNYLRTRNPLDSFRFAASCGAATAYARGLATRENIDSFYEDTVVSTYESLQ